MCIKFLKYIKFFEKLFLFCLLHYILNNYVINKTKEKYLQHILKERNLLEELFKNKNDFYYYKII